MHTTWENNNSYVLPTILHNSCCFTLAGHFIIAWLLQLTLKITLSIPGPRTTLSLGHPRCSVLQISVVQVSVLIQGFSIVQVILSVLVQGFSAVYVFLSALFQGSALCKNFQEHLVISASPRSALFKAALCEALVYSIKSIVWWFDILHIFY